MNKYFVGDFETSVYDGQTTTEVWASALVELYTDNVIVFNNIDDTWKLLSSYQCDIDVYYHNLKFDGSFWLSYLLRQEGLKQALEYDNSTYDNAQFMSDKDMPINSFKYLISATGQWYSITIRLSDHYIRFKDSLKLLPFSVKRIGESFNTKHRKSNIEYKGERHAYGVITPEEAEYIKNDTLVVKEALEIMFNEGHNKLTIGSCCLSEYQDILNSNREHIIDDTMDVNADILSKDVFEALFPDLFNIKIDKELYGSDNAFEYIHKSYHGGWCYVAKGKAGKIYHNGCTADVNSLYPSVMSSESGSKYPYGKPKFIKIQGKPFFINNVLDKVGDNQYYFIRIKTRFYIKDGMLPCIQIKNDLKYNPTEWLETSDVYDYDSEQYYKYYKSAITGEIEPCKVTLTLTETDWKLINEHYNLVDLEILDMCIFSAKIGLFDEYINKYKILKQTSKGARRELAKLFLNNLYGKMATNTNSSFKIALLKDTGELTFINVIENNKKPGYIAVGSAITSYARNFTIRSAQKNYHGIDKPGFIYADTDSIHCDISPESLVDIPVHNSDFNHWKIESEWDEAIFVRQKTYIEHNIKADGNACKPYYNVKCAGMNDHPKKLFTISLNGDNDLSEEDILFLTKLSDEDRKFLYDKNGNLIKRTLKDFNTGLEITGKLLPKQIEGGILLVETTFKMRKAQRKTRIEVSN